MVTTMVTGPAAVGAGATAGVEALFRAHYRRLVGLARLLVDDPGQAEEVVQDAFVALHRRWESARDPLAYLRMSVVNGARGRLRRRATVRRHDRTTVVETAPPVTVDADLLLDEQHRAVAAALARLSDRQRACVALRYYGELTEAETAAALGISVGAVKTHTHRALAHLAELLEDLR